MNMPLYLIAMYLVSLVFGYVVEFTGATLAIGRSLSDAGTSRGYQDAVTPPWITYISLLTYATSLLGIIYGFWAFGGVTGVSVVVGFLLVTSLNKRLLLPNANSQHFRTIIIQSMIYRYANYLKEGDALRATVMSELLEKLGIPASSFVVESTNKRDP
jgi:hypothetical protein